MEKGCNYKFPIFALKLLQELIDYFWENNFTVKIVSRYVVHLKVKVFENIRV